MLCLSVADSSASNTDFMYLSRSHDHRMFEVGRNLQRSSGPTHLLKAGPVFQNHVHMAFEYLQGLRLHNLKANCASETVFPDI